MRVSEPKSELIGRFWLSKRPIQAGKNDSWCRTWIDSSRREIRRVSLGTADFREATEALTRWVAERSEEEKI